MQEPPENQSHQQYAEYYRPKTQFQGSSQKLRALANGYIGLSNIFLLNFLLDICVGSIFDFPGPRSMSVGFGAVVLTAGLLVGYLTHGPLKKLAFGAGWPPGTALFVSILMGVNSVLCFGIIGNSILQSIALKKMKAFGVMPRAFSVKKDIVTAIQDLQRQEAMEQTHGTPPVV